LGGTLNRLTPSLTLSCGTEGKNFTTDNISVGHLLNINRIVQPGPDRVWTRIPPEAWEDPGFDSHQVDALS
jgi:acetaldehyde dehydrogenase/alcohol dehydrogenase